MSLTRERLIDKVEFVGEWKIIQVRNKTVIKENDVIISESYDRDTYCPGAELPLSLQPYADGVWTESFISDYTAYLESLATSQQYPEPVE